MNLAANHSPWSNEASFAANSPNSFLASTISFRHICNSSSSIITSSAARSSQRSNINRLMSRRKLKNSRSGRPKNSSASHPTAPSMTAPIAFRKIAAAFICQSWYRFCGAPFSQRGGRTPVLADRHLTPAPCPTPPTDRTGRADWCTSASRRPRASATSLSPGPNKVRRRCRWGREGKAPR
jgi:hypothetical protein